MTESGASAVCSRHLKTASSEAAGWTSVGGVRPKYHICLECQGKNRPPELEIIDINDMEGATMPAKKRHGKCELCGRTATVRKYGGHTSCCTCENIVRAAKLRPKIAVKLIGEYHGDKYFPRLERDDSDLLEVVSKLRHALGVKADREPMLDELPEIVSQLTAQLAKARDDAKDSCNILMAIKDALDLDASENEAALPGIIETMRRNLEKACDRNADLENKLDRYRATEAAPTEPENDTQRAIASMCDHLREILLAKNRAYGNSALEPVRVFSRAPAEEQILVRIDDKLSRLARGSEFPGDDTIMDLAGYLVLLLVQRRKAQEPGNSGYMLDQCESDDEASVMRAEAA